jgi:hypothetical protein
MTSTERTEAFQIPIEAAEAYEAAFVPAFFAQWAPILCDAADLGPGQKVLDVAWGPASADGALAAPFTVHVVAARR